MAPARHGPARAALRATGSEAADRLPRRHRRHSGKSARHGQHHDPAADNHPTDAPSCSLFSPACWRFSPEHGSAQTSALRDRPASTHPLPGWRTYRTWRLATSGDQPQAPPPPGKRTAQPAPVAQTTRRVLLASISASSATWRLSLSCQAPFTITDSARCCRWVNAHGSANPDSRGSSPCHASQAAARLRNQAISSAQISISMVSRISGIPSKRASGIR